MKLDQKIESPFNPVLAAPIALKDDSKVKGPETVKSPPNAVRQRAKSKTRHRLYAKVVHVSMAQTMADDLFKIAEYNALTVPQVVRIACAQLIDRMK